MIGKEKNSVLIIDDEKANCLAIAQILKNEYSVYVSTDGYEGIEVAKKNQPDVILLDIIMPRIDGFAVIAILKNTFETKNIPVIIITGLNNENDEEKGLSLGAEDYITKPFSPAVVKLRVKKTIQTLNQIEIIKQLSSSDQQTGILFSPEEFSERIKLMWNHSKLTKTTITIIYVYINNFHTLIELLGEIQGNVALHIATKVIEQSFINSINAFSRLGGSKFGIVLVDYDKQKSLEIANIIQKNVERTLEAYTRGRVNNFIVSIGVTSYLHSPEIENEDAIYTEPKLTVEEFIAIADQTFVTAKIRNKIVQTYRE